MPVPVLTSDLTFGVEIECILSANSDGSYPLTVGNYHRGIQIPGLPEGWNAQRDASIHTRGGIAVEIVSPKLTATAESALQIQQVCQWIKDHGGRVNASCGLHVHVGLNNHLNPVNINKLVMLTQYWAPALYAITGTTKREKGSYCKQRAANRATMVVNQPTVEQKAVAGGDRFHLLNLTNLAPRDGVPAKKTVEFRVFSGTVNYVKIISYVQVALALAEAACGPINMTSLKMNPTGKLAGEIAQLRYSGIVRELVRFCWRIPARPGKSAARGVITPMETLLKCKDELFRLGKVYSKAKQTELMGSGI